MSEPTDLSAPRDPAAYRAKPLLGPTFWAMIALCVLCVLAGVAAATLLPRFWAAPPPARAAEPGAAPEPGQTPAPVVVRPSSPPAAVTDAAPIAPDLARLSARVGVLETRQSHLSQAAAAALAAGAVADAAQGSGPFPDAVATLAVTAPPSPELLSLSRLAQAGAPSRTALAASFPEYAARAASAGRAPGEKAGIGDRIVYLLSKAISLRRVGDVPGGSVDALLARAEQAVADGDLERALRILDRLPPAARDAISPWRGRAERRAEIDHDAQALRARALQALAAESKAGPA